MPCIIATKRKSTMRNLTLCNKVIFDCHGHFASMTEAKKSKLPVCQQCRRVWKEKHPVRPRTPSVKRSKIKAKKHLIHSPSHPLKRIPKIQDINDPSSWDLTVFFKVRTIAKVLANDEVGSEHD